MDGLLLRRHFSSHAPRPKRGVKWRFGQHSGWWGSPHCACLKLRIHERAKWLANHSRTVREPNERMCGRDCEPVLHHPQMARIPFTTNRNLLVFCANTKRTGCAGCPFHAPGVLCSPLVCGKLINRAPHMNSAARKRYACVDKVLGLIPPDASGLFCHLAIRTDSYLLLHQFLLFHR